MRHLAAIVILFVAATGCFAQSTNAQRVVVRIERDGADSALQSFLDSPTWDVILRGIRSGRSEWITVYQKLKPASDAHSSEELEAALSDAMIANPFQVIPIYEQQGYTAQQICDFQFEVDCPEEGIASYLRRLETNLSNPKSDKERAMKSGCLQGIATTVARFKNKPDYCELGA